MQSSWQRLWKWTKSLYQLSGWYCHTFQLNHTIILKYVRVSHSCCNCSFSLTIHQLPEQRHWGGRCSGPCRGTAVQPQTGVSEVSVYCLLLMFVPCPLHSICVCSCWWCGVKRCSLMHVIIQYTEEYDWSRRSQKDCRCTEDKPDSHKADVILNQYSIFIH